MKSTETLVELGHGKPWTYPPENEREWSDCVCTSEVAMAGMRSGISSLTNPICEVPVCLNTDLDKNIAEKTCTCIGGFENNSDDDDEDDSAYFSNISAETVAVVIAASAAGGTSMVLIAILIGGGVCHLGCCAHCHKKSKRPTKGTHDLEMKDGKKKTVKWRLEKRHSRIKQTAKKKVVWDLPNLEEIYEENISEDLDTELENLDKQSSSTKGTLGGPSSDDVLNSSESDSDDDREITDETEKMKYGIFPNCFKEREKLEFITLSQTAIGTALDCMDEDTRETVIINKQISINRTHSTSSAFGRSPSTSPFGFNRAQSNTSARFDNINTLSNFDRAQTLDIDSFDQSSPNRPATMTKMQSNKSIAMGKTLSLHGNVNHPGHKSSARFGNKSLGINRYNSKSISNMGNKSLGINRQISINNKPSEGLGFKVPSSVSGFSNATSTNPSNTSTIQIFHPGTVYSIHYSKSHRSINIRLVGNKFKYKVNVERIRPVLRPGEKVEIWIKKNSTDNKDSVPKSSRTDSSDQDEKLAFWDAARSESSSGGYWFGPVTVVQKVGQGTKKRGSYKVLIE